MTDKPDLLPCPFCGSENIDPKGWASTNSAGPACDDCGASAGGVSGTLQDNIARWNTRANVAHATAAKDAEIEALRVEVGDYRMNGAAAVRFAPNSAYWSNELRRLFGDDARTGIEVLENQYRQELARAERLAEALREAADDLERGIDARIVIAQLRAAQHPTAAQEDGQ